MEMVGYKFWFVVQELYGTLAARKKDAHLLHEPTLQKYD